MLFVSEGVALLLVRIDQPAEELPLGLPADLGDAPRGRLVEADLVLMLHQAAGLDEAGGRQSFVGDHEARRQSKAVGQRIGLPVDRGGDADPGVAEQEFVADTDAETVE